ncbi:MFS transporter [Myxococcota bacterium]|nr:MFS transporter [Myxococcota bacterium]
MATVLDRRLIYVAAFVRATATGMLGVLLGLYLSALALAPAQIGVVVGLGLGGATVAAIVTTLAGDWLGRKRVLVAIALLGAAGSAIAASAPSSAVLLGAAAFTGMLNGMGRDRGASLILEQAILPSTTSDAERTRVFAWYNVLQDAGHGAGALLAGVPTLLRDPLGLGPLDSIQYMVAAYAVFMLLNAALYVGLSRAIEAPSPTLGVSVSPESRGLLFKISALFAMDALGGGFLTASLLSFFFFERFGVSEAVIGLLFFGARVANALSHLGASWLAKRIGLVNTMVFTHIPSSLLLATVAWAPSFPVAAILFLLREGLVEMDVPTRQSYVMAVVRPEERTAASGITHVVRVGAWAVAPSLAGLFMQGAFMGLPLVAAAGIKITYDVLLYRAFVGLRPPEERAPTA